ncbi:MAG: phosphotriesterase family protein [Actinomycetes bacterium]
MTPPLEGSWVETVRGPVAGRELGRVLMHEHVFVLSPEFVENYPEHEGFREEVHVPEAVARLNALAEAGIDTIVDPTVIGLGRDIPRVQKIAAQVDLDIVVATGLYTYEAVPLYLRFRGPGTLLGGEDPLVEMFVRDIRDGIAGTGVKAGVLKCATDEPGMSADVERVVRAVAVAHRETSVPIMTHTHAPSRRGLEQQDVLEAEGVDLSRVLIGHCGDTTDLDYLAELLARGSYLGMDRFGLDLVLPFEERVATVAALCERGHADRLVLSHDASCYIDWLPMEQLPQMLPNWHYLHLTQDVLPALRARGVTEGQIRTMLIDNPRRILTGELT